MLSWQEATLYESDGADYPKAVKPEPPSGLDELVAWLAEQTWSEFAQSLASQYRRNGSLSPKQISAAESMKTKCEARQATRKATKTAVASDGIYEKDGVIFKVQYAVNGSGNLYAKRLVVIGEGKAEWEYEGRKPLYELTDDDRLTEEQAREFGRLYGVCAICGRTLTDEGSIADGIGPICAGKQSW